MYLRPIYKTLLDHIKKKQVTVITGMRRVGKSTAVKYVLENLGHSNYLFLDCERVEVRVLLNQPNYENIKRAFELQGLDFSGNCVIAFDEIQLVLRIPSIIKYLYDTYGVKFIVTGSSSYYMKNTFSESLAGRKRIFEIYPLSFKEFLIFKEAWKDDFEKEGWGMFDNAWYQHTKGLYEEYLAFGGFPEVVLEPDNNDKKEMLRDIINSYIELDVKILSDFTVSEELYKLLKLLAARAGNKVDHSKLASITGISRQKIATYLQLLEQTYIIYQLSPFTRNIDAEISSQKKLYFSDNGLLQIMAENQLSSGQIFENQIAAQLKPQGELQYYQKKSGQEIDFIFQEKIAIEVKETPIGQDNKTLKQRAGSIQLDKTHLIGRFAPKNGYQQFVWGGTIF